MLTPRPNKFRGARAVAVIAANAGTSPVLIYRPPASGAIIRKPFTSSSFSFSILPDNALPAFTSGLAVTSLNVFPTWGTDYSPTGVVQAGQLAAVLDGWTNSVITAPGDWMVFPPNVVAVGSQVLNSAVTQCLEFEEFLSAEELDQWRSSPA
jgi:hypothetical protein